MNIFTDTEVATRYDGYYTEGQGATIDCIEKEAVSILLQKIPSGHMLEIGCGTGHWTSFFAQKGFRIEATDVSEAMLSVAKKKNIEGAEFSIADVLQLPFADAQFDQLAVITALEFCGNISQAFSEMKRVLKPGGWLIAGCLNADSVLGQTREQDAVLKHGHFLSKNELMHNLLTVGVLPEIIECVFLSPEFEIQDGKTEKQSVHGVFMAAAVQKK